LRFDEYRLAQSRSLTRKNDRHGLPGRPVTP
jgi:hypothetical protein